MTTFLVTILTDDTNSTELRNALEYGIAYGKDVYSLEAEITVVPIEHKPEDFTQIMAAVTQAHDLGTGVLRMLDTAEGRELRSMPPGLEQTLGSWVLEHLGGAELAYDRDPAGFGYGPILSFRDLLQIPLSQEQVRQLRPFWERIHGAAENEGELRVVSMEQAPPADILSEIAKLTAQLADVGEGTVTATYTRVWVCRNERNSKRCTPIDHRPTTGRGEFERPSVHADCCWVHVDQ